MIIWVWMAGKWMCNLHLQKREQWHSPSLKQTAWMLSGVAMRGHMQRQKQVIWRPWTAAAAIPVLEMWARQAASCYNFLLSWSYSLLKSVNQIPCQLFLESQTFLILLVISQSSNLVTTVSHSTDILVF